MTETKDKWVVIRMPAAEKEMYVDLSTRTGRNLSQVVREALARYRPIMEKQATERDRALAGKGTG